MSTRWLIVIVANALPWIILAIRANIWADDHERRIAAIEAGLKHMDAVLHAGRRAG
jgi:hypothetical protein